MLSPRRVPARRFPDRRSPTGNLSTAARSTVFRALPFVTLAVALVLGGCNAARPPAPRIDGPVSLGDTAGTTCLPANPAGVYTMGFDLIRNDGDQPVTITKVEAVGGFGVQVAESFLLPVLRGGGTLVGVGPWPPTKPPSTWNAKTQALGSDRLDPGDASVDGWNLVLRLSATGAGAGYDHLVVGYTVGSVDYTAANHVALEIRTGC